MKTISLIGAVAFICAFSIDAYAATVTFSENDIDYTASTLPTSSFNPSPVTSTGTDTTVTGEVPNQYRSPFENIGSAGGTLLSDGGYGIGAWANLAYTSVQAGGSATYNLSSPANSLSILWGSPDSYNTLTFYSDLNGTGTNLFSITGSQLEIQTFGHDQVDFLMTDASFMSVVLTSSTNAFEFADLNSLTPLTNISTTPLPAALPLFATGLGAMGFFGWRRKRKAQAAA